MILKVCCCTQLMDSFLIKAVADKGLWLCATENAITILCCQPCSSGETTTTRGLATSSQFRDIDRPNCLPKRIVFTFWSTSGLKRISYTGYSRQARPWITLTVLFGLGYSLSFTPCVLSDGWPYCQRNCYLHSFIVEVRPRSITVLVYVFWPLALTKCRHLVD